MSWPAFSPSGFMHHLLLTVTLSLSHTFPLSRHAPPRSRTLLLLVSSLIAHHHSRPLSFSLSRTMATMVGGSQELGGAGVGCGER
jgi:hypothetical protein